MKLGTAVERAVRDEENVLWSESDIAIWSLESWRSAWVAYS